MMDKSASRQKSIADVANVTSRSLSTGGTGSLETGGGALPEFRAAVTDLRYAARHSCAADRERSSGAKLSHARPSQSSRRAAASAGRRKGDHVAREVNVERVLGDESAAAERAASWASYDALRRLAREDVACRRCRLRGCGGRRRICAACTHSHEAEISRRAGH
jgi:hypothetical protein